MAHLWDWLRRVRRWLWGTRFVCLALGVPAVLSAAGLLLAPSELTIRFAGMLLELASIVFIALGLYETGKKFERPQPWHALRKFPPWRPRAVEGELSGVAAMGFGGRFEGDVSLSPDATLERRVEKLESEVMQQRKGIRTLHDRVEKIEGDTLPAERSERLQAERDILQKIDDSIAGGLPLAWVGTAWLIFGVVLTAVPDMIACWLH